MTTFCRADLAQFTGDPQRYELDQATSLWITNGVRFLADAGHAWPLIETIAGHYPSLLLNEAVRRDPRVGGFHAWRIQVQVDRSAHLSARADTDTPLFLTQWVPFTALPLTHVDLWASPEDDRWVLYLPSEH